MKLDSEIDLQKRYYAETAQQYEEAHVHEEDEHFFALSFLLSGIEHFDFKSVLDVGSGTGRAVAGIKAKRPDVFVRGVEPIQELREVGYRSGLSPEELLEGDATNLHFDSGSFDVVCEFAMLHHIRNPEQAIHEMLRVARRAVFISDINNFGTGGLAERTMKQVLNALRLWRAADFIKTRGKGYTVLKGDGPAFSYSVYNNYKQIQKECRSIHIINTLGSGVNPYRSASHIALLGIKK